MLRPLSLAVLAGCLAAAACATPQQASYQENLLISAGFTALPADTPRRVAILQRLPKNRVVKQLNGTGRYVYADPIVCNCLYLGDQSAYARYQQITRARNLQAQTQAAAEEAPFELGEFLPGT